jgi:AraC-like DNA-binding protein
MSATIEKKYPYVLYSCYTEKSREGESFVPCHVFTHVIAGTLRFRLGNQVVDVQAGDSILLRRNQLVKGTKFPPETGGEFRSMSVFLDEPALRSFGEEYHITTGKPYEGSSFISLHKDAMYDSYVDSLGSYLREPANEALTSLKVKEAILLLLKLDNDARSMLFDFNNPAKIDLETYMNNNFTFNVDLKRFAYLTGRSLATFKRDFDKIFHTSPSRWLQQRRLKEAYRLIKDQRKRPSDVYLEVGFEDLSHFSFAFKKSFGIAPSMVAMAS